MVPLNNKKTLSYMNNNQLSLEEDQLSSTIKSNTMDAAAKKSSKRSVISKRSAVGGGFHMSHQNLK
jgi:hypothetical protein